MNWTQLENVASIVLQDGPESRVDHKFHSVASRQSARRALRPAARPHHTIPRDKLLQALLKPRGRPVAKQSTSLRNVPPGQRHIPRLRGISFKDDPLAGNALEQFHHLRQFYSMAMSTIEPLESNSANGMGVVIDCRHQ